MHRYGTGTVPEDQKLVLCLGLDPEEDLETLLLVGRGKQGPIVDIRQDVSPTRINQHTSAAVFFKDLRVR